MDLSLEKIKAGHKLVAEFKYELRPVVKGYADRTLYINLSDNTIKSKPVTDQMKDLFTGGRGFCLWLLWNAIKDTTQWDDPENEFLVAGGPIGGITSYPGTGKSTVVTLSPLTKTAIDSNGGGYFGPYLKFSGWDALEIQGKAEKDVIIFIDGDSGKITIEEAPLETIDSHIITRTLTEMYADDKKNMRNISIISAGAAADHVAMCGVNLSFYDPRRNEVRLKQAARGGAGRVLRDKKIKAIVVKFSSVGPDNNGVSDMALIRKAGKRINTEITDLDAIQNDMRHVGTTNLIETMNKFDLLPVENYRYGADDKAELIAADKWRMKFDYRAPDGCWYGCSMACSHGVSGYKVKTGPYAGQEVMVDGPEYETLGGVGSNLRIFDPEAILEINFYCDTYGVDTISFGTATAFVMECYAHGEINNEITGGLDLSWGNSQAVIELLHQMARGEGFGVTVGQGIRYMKDLFVNKYGADKEFVQDIGMEVKGLEVSEYIPKESLAQQGGYAMANKGPQHDEAWLIFMDLVNKQIPTFEKKAEALHYFPIFRTWFSLQGLCKLPWNDIIPKDNKNNAEPGKVPEHVENYCWLYEGVTGKKFTIDDLIFQSEKVFNFQRIFNLRMGYGTRKYDYPPYRAVGPASKEEYLSRQERYDTQLKENLNLDASKMSIEEKMDATREYRMDQYNKLMDAVYLRRGWTSNAVPTVETLQKLGIDLPEVVEVVKKHGG
jgi:aldehyde:ferredoxin oxidoreductase